MAGGLAARSVGDEDVEGSPLVEKIRAERGYNYKDVITVSPGPMDNFEAKIKMFFEEHLHADERDPPGAGRLGYFDVRDRHDRWVRVLVERGDLLVLPAGIYHRFTCDDKDYIKACRLFCGVPVWKAHNRSPETEAMPERGSYVQQLHGTA
ncbi:LOW QUALITY PROTEIN: 1,2-dihydroxy-3-keto-5-methylthiopentene dioxygenase-like [Pollicipes pollicipes]|uniref:LOW QUALITY PROTEIN: 1,2-dihydroxy-3-keto-5-methylthiopentene dioxygenase-like n=1 Tax=Pollicipes pollicipes TaxID=41117 RepID=UPI0018854003|nr:LOW QUALITY PROTEIN: 1,2-dihydroxy-3-keto-5-methylthiopentene dioxygenase-like [Pollicipes pollicipes]